MKKCFLYSRVSSDGQKFGDGLDRQKKALENFLLHNAQQLNLSTSDYEFISDSGRSAWKGHQMHENAALGVFFKRVETGELNGCVLLCESLDRLSRENPFKCVGYLATLAEHNIDLIDVGQNLVISRSNPMSLTMATIIAQRAYEESTLKSKRIKSAWTARRIKAKENGSYMIKNTPFWVSVDDLQGKYVLNELVEIVREIFDLYLNGYGSYTIARKMNDNGKTINGKRWSTPKICALLRNPRCKGDFISNSLERDYDNGTSESVEHVIHDLYPRVVSDSEFLLVETKLATHNKRGRIRDDRKLTVLNGLLKCAICGEALSLRTVNEYRYVGCLKSIEKDKSCHSKAVRYEIIERVVLNHVKNLDFQKIYQGNHSQIDLIQTQMVTIKEHIEQYNKGILKLKEKGRKPSFDMLEEVRQSQEELELLSKKLSEFTSIQEIEKFTIDESIFDVGNVSIRGRLELSLSRLLKRIKVYSSKDMGFLMVDVNYYNEVLKHILIVSKKGEVLGNVSIRNSNGVSVYESQSIKISNDGETIKLDTTGVVLDDYLFLMNIVDFIDGGKPIKEFMNERLNSVLAGTVA